MLSISTNLKIISPNQLVLFPPLILEKYELWRLFTAHLLSTGSSMLWHIVFLYQYSRDLETSMAHRKGDYVFLLILMMLAIDVAGASYGFMLLSEPFGMSIVTLFANADPQRTVNFMFGFQFKAQFLPWVLLAFVSLYDLRSLNLTVSVGCCHGRWMGGSSVGYCGRLRSSLLGQGISFAE